MKQGKYAKIGESDSDSALRTPLENRREVMYVLNKLFVTMAILLRQLYATHGFARIIFTLFICTISKM